MSTNADDQDILNFFRNQLSAAKQAPEYQALHRQYEAAKENYLGGDFGTATTATTGMLMAGQNSRAALRNLASFVISVDPGAHLDR